MGAFFVFSDEAGAYKQNRNAKFLKIFPYYIRSAFILKVEYWMNLKNRFIEIKKGKGLPINREIKWSYIWSLRKHRKNDEDIPCDRPYYFLKDISDEVLLDYLHDVCTVLHDFSKGKIIYTITMNDIVRAISKGNIYKMHLQELMQRLEMEMQSAPNNLAIFSFDPENQEADSLIRNGYREIYQTGDFISEYSHIKDSISFELSHHSVGIQMADYIAGIFNGFLRGYSTSKNLFQKYILDLVRKSPTGDIFGFGIREVPRSDEVRNITLDKFKTVLQQPVRVDLEEDLDIIF